MTRFVARTDPGKLLEEANRLPYWLDGSGAEMALRQGGGLPQYIGMHIALAIKEISDRLAMPAIHAMINRVPAGIEVPVHTDTLVPCMGVTCPHMCRWHLPLITTPEAFWWDKENDRVHMEVGYWYGPMKHWIDHTVHNLGSHERIHLIVDLFMVGWEERILPILSNLGES